MTASPTLRRVWGEGGAERIGTSLHIAGGALLSGLGGGSVGTALQGAAGAGLTSAFAGKLNSMADAVGGETGSTPAANIASNVPATVDDTTAAFTASNADLYNRQLHDEGGVPMSSNPVPEVSFDRAIPPPDLLKVGHQIPSTVFYDVLPARSATDGSRRRGCYSLVRSQPCAAGATLPFHDETDQTRVRRGARL